MKIKEVEKRTGLSAKSIRMYEAKGLLDVKRLEENDYRDYTEENVTELKKVKVLRYLEFSLDEIFSMKKMDKETLRQVFSKKADQLENQRDSLEIKRDLCRRLGKDGGMPDPVSYTHLRAHET